MPQPNPRFLNMSSTYEFGDYYLDSLTLPKTPAYSCPLPSYEDASQDLFQGMMPLIAGQNSLSQGFATQDAIQNMGDQNLGLMDLYNDDHASASTQWTAQPPEQEHPMTQDLFQFSEQFSQMEGFSQDLSNLMFPHVLPSGSLTSPEMLNTSSCSDQEQWLEGLFDSSSMSSDSTSLCSTSSCSTPVAVATTMQSGGFLGLPTLAPVAVRPGYMNRILEYRPTDTPVAKTPDPAPTLEALASQPREVVKFALATDGIFHTGQKIEISWRDGAGILRRGYPLAARNDLNAPKVHEADEVLDHLFPGRMFLYRICWNGYQTTAYDAEKPESNFTRGQLINIICEQLDSFFNLIMVLTADSREDNFPRFLHVVVIAGPSVRGKYNEKMSSFTVSLVGGNNAAVWVPIIYVRKAVLPLL
ncbi:hypothetical protein A0H81_04938 [Grifola frondosa]|uniref:Uncharacterized protein n=1 Tax=Grifola frondosa TaxID=5627 RepID=A0A1C7ML56_GRIFR|nr:hypothetical protein A0H81_04938 [Grifola frondosa]